MWRALPSSEAIAEFTATETAALNAIQGGSTALAAKLTVVVRKWVGAMAAAGNTVLQDGTVPDQLRTYILAETVWEWLKQFPRLDFFKTKGREKSYEEAATVYKSICLRQFGAIESPYGTDSTTANWNSQPKIIGRMNPIPPPRLQQAQVPTPIYANPNAPSDTVPDNSPGVPGIPPGLQAIGQNGKVLLVWDAGYAAVTYSLYRGIVGGQETLLTSGLTNLNYTDTAVVNETTYFYRVASVNPVGTSILSSEVTAKPTASSPV